MTANQTVNAVSEMAKAMELIHDEMIGDGQFTKTTDWEGWSAMITLEHENVKERDIDEMDQDDIYESLCDGDYHFDNHIDNLSKDEIIKYLKANYDVDVCEDGRIQNKIEALEKEKNKALCSVACLQDEVIDLKQEVKNAEMENDVLENYRQTMDEVDQIIPEEHKDELEEEWEDGNTIEFIVPYVNFLLNKTSITEDNIAVALTGVSTEESTLVFGGLEEVSKMVRGIKALVTPLIKHEIQKDLMETMRKVVSAHEHPKQMVSK
jgi:hypothetical protein